MSDFRAAAGVTQKLVELINRGLRSDDEAVGGLFGGAHAVAGPPLKEPSLKPVGQIQVFLYQVDPNPNWRNYELPMRRSDGSVVQRPMAALDLHYLLTFYGEEKQYLPELLLGSTIAALHAHPTLETTDFPKRPDDPLDGSGLEAQAEVVRFRQNPFSHDELSKLWSVFFQVPYSLSVSYLCSVVLIEPKELIPQPSLPVRAEARSGVGALKRPSVTAVVPAIVNYEPAAEVTLSGEHLDDPKLQVRVDGASGTIRSATEGRLVFSLPAEIQAGAHTVTVVGVGGTSEPASFIVRPTVDPLAELSADGKTISVAAAPTPADGGQVELLLNEAGDPGDRSPRSFQFVGRLGGDGRLRFPVPKAAAKVAAGASYLFRVEMGGVRSELTVGADGRYDGPIVEIPA